MAIYNNMTAKLWWWFHLPHMLSKPAIANHLIINNLFDVANAIQLFMSRDERRAQTHTYQMIIMFMFNQNVNGNFCKNHMHIAHVHLFICSWYMYGWANIKSWCVWCMRCVRCVLAIVAILYLIELMQQLELHVHRLWNNCHAFA